jgi:hypothetical protein
LRCRSIGVGDLGRTKVVLNMTESESPLRPDSTCSEQTEDSGRSDAILALGRKLVEELGLEPSVDTLGRWMAHYIADLMAKAKNATADEKGPAEKNCLEAILALWKHRAEMPNAKRPFEETESIVRAIQSLDPDEATPRYFRSVLQLEREGEGKEKSEAETWLDMATRLFRQGFDWILPF